ncbi:hypothetical protein QPK87_01180 [Kamptonema cortianum]|nr:hypothetical protein [Geitlerinema splendidum]MDK3155201.1 hypothetical protein [Kamptonema cortianum]
MPAIVYQPPDVLHWFDTEAKRESVLGFAKGAMVARKTTEEGIIPGIKQAAGAALSIGRSAVGGFLKSQGQETRYELHDSGFECIDLTRRVKVSYSDVRQIISRPNHQTKILYNGGSVTIKPVAHLVAGRYKVPIGWLRNGMEVPYAMLIEEISARTGVEIEAE